MKYRINVYAWRGQEFEKSIESHHLVVNKLFESGTYLRHFGSRDRLVNINSTLCEVYMQWRQLNYDAEMYGRRLLIACRDDKRVTRSSYVMLCYVAHRLWTRDRWWRQLRGG